MSHWNHRAIKRTHPDGTVQFGIHEVFYDGEEPSTWAKDPARAIAFPERDDETDPLLALRWTLESMLKALECPVLDWDERERKGEGEDEE